MKIEVLRLAIDFGLFILIWMVQLLIYPSFKWMSTDTFKSWHRNYMQRITYIVAPLMIAQTGLCIYFFYYYPAMVMPNITYSTLVASTWISTFIVFIPLHGKLDRELNKVTLCDSLTRKNWIRVALWTGVLILDLFLLY